MNTHRPLGLVFLIAYCFVFAVLSIVGFTMLAIINAAYSNNVFHFFDYMSVVCGILFFSLFTVGGVGLIKRKNWGRISIIIVSILIALLQSFLEVYVYQGHSIYYYLEIYVLINLAIIFYLFNPKIKKYFSPADK